MEIQEIAKVLINPLLHVFAGMLLLLFLRKQRAKILLFLTAYLYLASITYTGQMLLKYWKLEDTYRPDKTYDAAIVLAGVSDARWHVERKNLPYIPGDFFASEETTDRILAGIHFVKSGHARRLLVGEWIYETYNEGRAIRRLASGMGLQGDQLHIYGRVGRTLDEARGIKRFTGEHSYKSILLVTSASHMRRALAMFKKQGLAPDIFSVNTESDEVTWKSFVPGIKGLKKTESYFYELAAYIGYFLKRDL